MTREKICSYSVRMSTETKEKLKENARKCGLSQSEYLRQLVEGVTPKVMEKTEFMEMQTELTRAFHILRELSPDYPEAMEETKRIIRMMSRHWGVS